MFSSSYKKGSASTLISAFVRSVNPGTVLEIGTQQGYSALAIIKGLKPGSYFATYDFFEEKYREPPYGNTHADIDIAKANLADAKGFGVKTFVKKGDADLAIEENFSVELMHIDICNHRDNIMPLMEKVKYMGNLRAIILEGGIYNDWQKENNFTPYRPALQEWCKNNHWDLITIPFNEHNAVTFLINKSWLNL